MPVPTKGNGDLVPWGTQCFPIEQTNVEPDYRTVRQMLEAKIAQCERGQECF